MMGVAVAPLVRSDGASATEGDGPEGTVPAHLFKAVRQ